MVSSGGNQLYYEHVVIDFSKYLSSICKKAPMNNTFKFSKDQKIL